MIFCKLFTYFLFLIIQTGFVETLKPQFVPGQAMGPSTISSSLDEKLSILQLQQENDNLKAQVLFGYLKNT